MLHFGNKTWGCHVSTSAYFVIERPHFMSHPELVGYMSL
jgi:hypothetical protein